MESKLLVLYYGITMRLRFHLLLIPLVAAPWLLADERGEQEKPLIDTFAGQTLAIRNFYVDDKLVFSPAAKLIVGGTPGDWTLARLEIEKIQLKPDQLTRGRSTDASRLRQGRR